ncbi:MAG: FAD-dependent monooxygenase [Candidatus Aminicenantes bacterium]|nr:FAD-dependent monooxygenase [Candidatus Aminicenantes bacterium]MDH5383684.1 FAD-dependent monooxygenase [Candidatus Aminicenantes bacterium]MDH5742394.1 FAD-dependent monooxygenase [Candidatus Aminicenantes bacterium]
MNQRFDAIVVGAGPAGCACGLILAKAGLETLIVERGKFAGAKNMWGGALYGPSLNELVPGFWQEAPVERYIQRHRYSLLTEETSLSTEFTSKKFGKPPYNGFSVLRSKFDRWFASKAEQAGAVVATGLEAEDLLWEGNAVTGIKAGGDELPASVVVACDGVNSLLAEKGGLRGKLSARDIKQGVKEVIQLPRQLIDQRFNLRGEEGIAWEFIGSFTRGIPGGAFIYTNKESLSIGVVVQLSALTERKVSANDLLEDFKRHPVVKNMLADGKLVEYSAHLIPVGGKAMMPTLYTDGFLVAGDAAAFTLTTGLVLEGANFAIASGKAAAETVIRAKQRGDFSEKSISFYSEILQKSFVLKDMETFKRSPLLLENPRFYRQYPELVCDLVEKMFTSDGKPRKKLWKLFRDSQKKRVSFWRMIRDFFQMKRSI